MIQDRANEIGKSIAELARECGTDPNYLYRKLKEPDWTPRVDLAIKIAKALNLSVEEIFHEAQRKASCVVPHGDEAPIVERVPT